MPSRASDVFFGMPGVTTQTRGDDPGTAVNIRGMQDFGRVAVLIDGARQNFQRTGHNADGVFYLEPEMLAAVDVVRGPVANIYGSGAIGGVVSFRTKDIEDVVKAGERWGVLTTGMVGIQHLPRHGLDVRRRPSASERRRVRRRRLPARMRTTGTATARSGRTPPSTSRPASAS